MGMLATAINALGLADALEQLGCDVRVQTAIAMNEIAEPYIRNRAVRHLEKGRVVIFACRTGSPFFSSRYRCCSPRSGDEADVILKASMVDGIYDRDQKGSSGGPVPRADYMDVLNRNLQVMDFTAATMCRDNQIPIMVFNLEDPENILRAVNGEDIGTIVR